MYCKKNVFIIIFLFFLFSAYGQMSAISDTFLKSKPNDTLMAIPQQPCKTAGWLLATNFGVWSFDRFVLNAPYSRINFNTVQRNFKTSLVWDNDKFSTNLFAHPYHGGLYFNAARTHGISFWNSVPYTAAGSFMWEFCMENEPPAINDLVSTIVGGASLGEMTFRISDVLIDNRTTGFNRLKREVLITLVSPIRGLNRWLNGDAWKQQSTKGNVIATPAIRTFSSIGFRMLKNELPTSNRIANALCFDIGMEYGDIFSDENEKPYDYFSLQLGGNAYPIQPIISHINALGTLYIKNYRPKNSKNELCWGVFQHFNFYEAYTNINNNTIILYQIAEAASIGMGLFYKTQLADNISLTSSAHLNAVLMGGCQTDHYKYDNRDYNMGSGYSSQVNVAVEMAKRASLSVHYGNIKIYSWTGFNNNGTGAVSSNVQGDKGNARLSVMSANLSYKVGANIVLQAEASLYTRKSIFTFYPTVVQKVVENKLSIGYVF